MGTEIQKEPLRELVAKLTGVHVSRVVWSGEPEKSIGPINGGASKITLNVVTALPVGSLEVRRSFTTLPAPAQTSEWFGREQVTISFRAENFLRAGEAYDTLRKLRFRMKMPANRRALRSSELAIIDSPSLLNLDRIVDTRVYSAASMDVRFNHTMFETPADGEGWIEKLSSDNPPDPAAAPVYDLHFTRVP